jgi:hypothetical protein
VVVMMVMMVMVMVMVMMMMMVVVVVVVVVVLLHLHLTLMSIPMMRFFGHGFGSRGLLSHLHLSSAPGQQAPCLPKAPLWSSPRNQTTRPESRPLPIRMLSVNAFCFLPVKSREV